MDIHLTPEIETLIRQHMAHGCSRTPEAVIMKALHALRREEMRQEHTHALPAQEAEEASQPVAAVDANHSPLLAYLSMTKGPRLGLEALRHQLRAIPGSMAQTVREDRDDRV